MNHKKIRNIALAVTVAMLFSIFGCGSSSNSVTESPLPNVNGSLYWQNLLNSVHYTGYLAVFFKESTEMKLQNGKMVSAADTYFAHQVNIWLDEYEADIQRGLIVSEETVEKAIAKAEKEGKKLLNWNMYFEIHAENPLHAQSLINLLSDSGKVRWIHPVTRSYNADVGDIGDIGGGTGGSTNLLTEQLYFNTESESGGLNIASAWNSGISGQDVRLVDLEHNWNFDHEDLPIGLEDKVSDASGSLGPDDLDVNDPRIIDHGTAVVGVLSGMDDEGANQFKGIASSSDIQVFQLGQRYTTGVAVGILNDLILGYVENGDTSLNAEPCVGCELTTYHLFLRPGDIIVLPVQWPGANTPGTGISGEDCTVDTESGESTYCVPSESYPNMFDTIRTAVDLGFVVVEGAGNGGVDLGTSDADCNEESCVDLGNADSGAVMVAASMGYQDNSKAPWSNWGSRVNTFAWGLDVVTSGYGDHPSSDPTDQNKWYTSYFNGTSSATAMVAGALALVQSYTKELYKDIILHKKVFLDSYQMRCLLDHMPISGTGEYGAYIGKKPDVGLMMQLVEEAEITCDYTIGNFDGSAMSISVNLLPRLAPDTEFLATKAKVVEGIRYDMDEDGRADLISYDQGMWKVDLSTVAPNIADPNPDNYGEWDLILNISPYEFNNAIIFPVVHDYDSDGSADLALYDSKYGYLYIKYTSGDILSSFANQGFDWDVVVDYSNDPAWKPYSRPMPGDYDGDNWLDFAVVTSDGHWVIDFGGAGRLEKFGPNIQTDLQYVSNFEGFEKDVTFLTNAQLVAAPGWAYIPIAINRTDGARDIVYKYPDGILNEGQISVIKSEDFLTEENFTESWILNNTENMDFMYGGNGSIMSGVSIFDDLFRDLIIFKEDQWDVSIGDGGWSLYSITSDPSWTSSPGLCHMVNADYDGDGKDDMAVKCSNYWKIAYHDEAIVNNELALSLDSERIVELDDSHFALPPTIYPGGLDYLTVKNILENYGEWEEYLEKDPFGPLTMQCIKLWAPPPVYCFSK